MLPSIFSSNQLLLSAICRRNQPPTWLYHCQFPYEPFYINPTRTAGRTGTAFNTIHRLSRRLHFIYFLQNFCVAVQIIFINSQTFHNINLCRTAFAAFATCHTWYSHTFPIDNALIHFFPQHLHVFFTDLYPAFLYCLIPSSCFGSIHFNRKFLRIKTTFHFYSEYIVSGRNLTFHSILTDYAVYATPFIKMWHNRNKDRYKISVSAPATVDSALNTMEPLYFTDSIVMNNCYIRRINLRNYYIINLRFMIDIRRSPNKQAYSSR